MKDDGRLDEQVRRVMLEAIRHLRDNLGASVETVDVPMFDLGLPAYYITAVSEASSNLSRYDGLRYGNKSSAESDSDESLMEAISSTRGELLGDEPLRRILMGTYTLSEGYGEALYKKAQVVRKKVQTEMLERLQSFDLLLTPTAPSPAYEANRHTSDPLQMYLGDIMTVNVNLAGFPAISVPAGLADQGNDNKKKAPVGIQFIGGPFEEAKLLGVAHTFEKTRALPLVPPEISIE
jgi:aspartyl-tRNA(Asn)/glutamyl-tRNA(Gln) amidotransferase subunit A